MEFNSFSRAQGLFGMFGQAPKMAPSFSCSRGQGTIEYLVIIAIVVVLSLVVVGIISSMGGGSASTISSATGKISQTSGSISITEAVIDSNGRGFISAGNNTGAGLTITGINVEGVEVDSTDISWSSFGESGFLLENLGDACSCDGFVGQTKTCEIIFYGRSEFGIDHNYKIITTVTCLDELSLVDESNVISPVVPIINSPVVTLFSPLDDAIIQSGVVDFNFSVRSVDTNVLDCNLKINSNLDANHILINSLLLSDTNFSIRYTLPLEADYNWNVTCYPLIGSGVNSGFDRNISYFVPIDPYVVWLRNGLVGYWPLDINMGDYSSSNRTSGQCQSVACNTWNAQMDQTTCQRIGCTWSGSCIGMTNICPDNNSVGKIGGNYDFNNLLMDHIFFDTTGLPMGNSPRAMSIWVYPRDKSNRYYILGYGVSNQREYRLSLNEWTDVALDACYAVWGAQGAVIDVNRWNHVLVTYSGSGSPQFYVNGVHYATIVNYGSPSVNTDAGGGTIGARGAGCGWWDDASMRGGIDEAAIWNRDLNTDEISWLYNSGNGRSLT